VEPCEKQFGVHQHNLALAAAFAKTNELEVGKRLENFGGTAKD
jgi:hypothetical protein